MNDGAEHAAGLRTAPGVFRELIAQANRRPILAYYESTP